MVLLWSTNNMNYLERSQSSGLNWAINIGIRHSFFKRKEGGRVKMA
jgi:hypothetical protein